MKKISRFVYFYENEIRFATKVINAVMLFAGAIIGLMVLNILAENGYETLFSYVGICAFAGVFAILGWNFCYMDDGERLPGYRVFLSPIVISLFIFGGCAVLVIACAILYCAGCFLFVSFAFIADSIAQLIINFTQA